MIIDKVGWEIKNRGSRGGGPENGEPWVLVCGNYAGNDELEPAVRVRLVMPKDTYRALKMVVDGGAWAVLDPALRGYLFHFGYLILE